MHERELARGLEDTPELFLKGCHGLEQGRGKAVTRLEHFGSTTGLTAPLKAEMTFTFVYKRGRPPTFAPICYWIWCWICSDAATP